ncbi:DEAD/DEAH box helicase [Pinibacter aurantiacus]|uniref:DEAD/DEAH box helicase n=1 Tax=Pinibacter aurantiacus TaxID=2851599 RepID=A0A9E2S9Z2_9BACT|nr:DEAD/DEAH box helicase [Pinibacter aurantiacus]MBV4358661.1 DEAD/DEAH box helicase [Pinibacter aurantiacus]
MQSTKYDLPQILTNLNIEALNEMQQASITGNEQHKDVILLSATGSGKTLAFILPVLEVLKPKTKGTQALVIVPSRELAMQIEKVFKQLGTGYKITCCYGGHKREIEENNLIEAPTVIVGTPGRLADHIRRENIKTDHIHALVLDEFDKSLELGFQEEMSEIIKQLPGLHKRILTSATTSVEIPDFVGLKDAATLNFLSDQDGADKALEVKQVLSPVNDKLETLFNLICFLGNRSTIVFCNHREAVERVSEYLSDKGIVSVFYHGALDQRERDSALVKFRNGTSNVLVTTDLAARGLDIPNIRYIIHYHLSLTEDTYTHRNGRTARMDASGTAILLIGADEKMPAYVTEPVEEIKLDGEYEVPEKPKWSTLYLPHGKKDKVNKIDIVGFLTQKGELKKDDIGLIEVKDFFSFVAVRKSKVSHTLQLIKEQKIKGKKSKFEVAK